MNDRNAFAEAERFLSNTRRPVLFSHEKPDGDALGSLLALRSMLRGRGVNAHAMLFDPIPRRYAANFSTNEFVHHSDEAGKKLLANCDAVIILDTCTYSQLRPIADWLRNAKVPKLVFDHHLTREDLADHYVIDVSAAATSLILYEFAVATQWQLEANALNAMFIGIATDTGWFRHSNADSRALAAAADLTDRGVKPFELFQSLYQQDSAARVKLLGSALTSLEFHGGKLAVITLDRDAFLRTGATPADTEDIVNEPLRIAPVLVSILFVEQEDGVVRVNFRSKPPLRGVSSEQADVDVAALAGTFGGGGHRRAAGARINGPLASAKEIVIAAALTAIANAKASNTQL